MTTTNRQLRNRVAELETYREELYAHYDVMNRRRQDAEEALRKLEKAARALLELSPGPGAEREGAEWDRASDALQDALGEE